MQQRIAMMRARQGLIVSIALSYAAAKATAKGIVYETQDTSYTFEISDIGLAPLLSEGIGSDATASEGTCFDGWCRDSPAYLSMLNLPCYAHSHFECALFIDMGFTQEQVDELIESCPCSCNVACPDKPLETSTSKPSAMPVSDPPTKNPSASPVSDPPTWNPSSSPVSDSPTRSPSMSPVSSNPTPLHTDAPSRLPTRSPTVSPSASPVSSIPTTRPSKAPVSENPTARPSKAVLHDQEVDDISDTPNTDEPGEDKDDEQVFVLAERSSWNTSFSSTNGTMFTPLFIGVIAGGAVLVVLFAAVMFSVAGQRLRHKRSEMNGGSEFNIKPYDNHQIQIDNLDELADEESAINVSPSAIFGLGVGNDNATMGPDGGGSTIKTMGSLQTTRSMIHSIMKSVASKEMSTKRVMESIEIEATQKKAEKVEKGTAEDPVKTALPVVQEETGTDDEDLDVLDVLDAAAALALDIAIDVCNVQPKDTTPIILIPIVVEEPGLLGIHVGSVGNAQKHAYVEDILPTANSACKKLQPGDILAPYQPKSTTERPTPYTLAEFARLVASNQRPLRFVAIRSTSSSAGTPEVVYMDIE